MAAISYGIMFAPQVVWDPLTEEQKENLCNYLNKINEHPLPVCNWILFAVLVNIAMKKVGRRYSSEMLEEYLNGLETFYLGEGWYQDGDSGQKDYYISFAIHFYSLIYAVIMEKDDPERAKKYKARAMEFAKQFIYWFDEEGEAIPFGRSLTYRFSQVSFFSVCLLAGLEPFPVPVMKGLIARHLRTWLKRPIFDRDHVLTIGYGYPNLTMAERYNAPGSPYWGMKVFAFLLLPDDHPFWSVEEAPLPKLAPACPQKYADLFVYHYGNHTTDLHQASTALTDTARSWQNTENSPTIPDSVSVWQSPNMSCMKMPRTVCWRSGSMVMSMCAGSARSQRSRRTEYGRSGVPIPALR